MYYAASPELRNKYDEAIKRREVMELAIRIFAGEQGRIEDLGGPGGGSRVHYTDLEKQKLAAVEFDCDALRKEIMEPK